MNTNTPNQTTTITSMANCLMLLSQATTTTTTTITTSPDRVFECKTCNRQFPSFQALGGHRASHKKPRLMDGSNNNHEQQSSSSPSKPKTHECSICGLEFAIGQALGGHMRRHRSSSDHHVIKRRKIVCLDLNLTPYENDLEFFRLGSNTSNMVGCFSL